MIRRSHHGADTLRNGVLTLLLGILIWREWGWVMTFIGLSFASLAGADSKTLGPGDYIRSFPMGEQTRSYLVHVPKDFDPKKPTPVILALHGASMNGPLMAVFCGLNPKADQDGFLVVYPNGTGNGCFRFWLQVACRTEGVARLTTWTSSAKCWMTSKRLLPLTRSGSSLAE